MHLPDQILESLFELAALLGQQNDYEEILRLTSQKAASFLNAETAIIMMINPRTRQTIKTFFKKEHGVDPGKYNTVQTFVSGWVIKNNQPFESPDIRTDGRFAKNLFKSIPSTSVLAL
ncbi:MAG: GAF domain-containing protein [bacterium]